MPRNPRPAKPKPVAPTAEGAPVFPPEIMAKRFPGGFTVRDEANAIVAFAFRNGPLEDLHAGKYSELLSDNSYSRITDDEMKSLMMNACQMMEKLLRLKETNADEYYTFIVQYSL